MELTGAALRRSALPSASPVAGRVGRRRRPAKVACIGRGGGGFAEVGHLRYYEAAPRRKAVEAVARDLGKLRAMGLVAGDAAKEKVLSEATDLLLQELSKMEDAAYRINNVEKEEKAAMKALKKQEKCAKKTAITMMNCEEDESSESSESDCEGEATMDVEQGTMISTAVPEVVAPGGPTRPAVASPRAIALAAPVHPGPMAEGSSRGYPSGSGDGWRLAFHDPDVVEVSAETAAEWSSSRRKKLRLSQVIPSDIIELDADDDPDGVMIIGEKISNQKNKQAVVHMDWPEHTMELQSGMSTNLAGPSVIPVTNAFPWDGLGSNHNNVAGPSGIPATNFYPWDGLGAYHGGALLPPVYFNEFVGAPGEDHNNKYYNYSTSLMESGSSFNSGANNYMDVPPGAGTVLPWGYMPSIEMPHQPSQTKVVNSEIDEKYKAFKQFDTVSDHSDHFYALPGQSNFHVVKKPSKAWVKRIQHEWKILEKDLPDTIYVRVYEDRMDLLRAVIIGPEGTPYHDGLFFFDVYFPSRYPSKPPLVNYRSGGLRLNPNLYECGKVCLSLLNTWSGTGCEKWNPSNSTMLQVLVSIQALVLNSKPYFNEPGYAMYANTSQGEKQSMAYNEEMFLLSCRTMQYSLRNPPKHFEDFIVGHFRNYGRKILKGCKSYMAGAQVGCLVGDGVQDVDEGDKSCSNNFKASLKPLLEDLLKEFANIGVNCDEFRNPGDTRIEADTILKL